MQKKIEDKLTIEFHNLNRILFHQTEIGTKNATTKVSVITLNLVIKLMQLSRPSNLPTIENDENFIYFFSTMQMKTPVECRNSRGCSSSMPISFSSCFPPVTCSARTLNACRYVLISRFGAPVVPASVVLRFLLYPLLGE